jgi:dolichol-phosphate mannosyltransferase
MITIVIPVYNEEKIIAENLRRVIKFMKKYEKSYEIVVVDDGSGDATLDAARAIAKRNWRVRVLKHGRNRGVGAAIRTGLRASKGDIVVTLDCDLTYPPEDIPIVVDAMKRHGADIAIGSPYAKGADFGGMSPIRLILSRGVNLMDQIIFGLPFTTPSSLFRAWNSKAAHGVRITFNRFEAISESVINAHRQGFKIIEVPIKYRTVKGRKSRMKILNTIKRHLEMDAKLLFRGMRGG